MSQEIVREIAELTARLSDLSARLSDAQSEKVAQQAKILDGDPKAPARAAAADQKIAALTGAISETSAQVRAAESKLAALQAKERRETMLRALAEHCRKAAATRAEYDATFREICSLVNDLVESLEPLRADLKQHRQQGLTMIEQFVPDICYRFDHLYSVENTQREDAMRRQLKDLNAEIACRGGVSTEAILTNYVHRGKTLKKFGSGRTSGLDVWHRFPDHALRELVESALEQSREECRRAGIAQHMIA